MSRIRTGLVTRTGYRAYETRERFASTLTVVRPVADENYLRRNVCYKRFSFGFCFLLCDEIVKKKRMTGTCFITNNFVFSRISGEIYARFIVYVYINKYIRFYTTF